MSLIGVAKEGWALDQLRARARESVAQHGGVDEVAFGKLSALLQYVDGDYREPRTYTQLRKYLGNAHHPLHYLAIPPSMFATVVCGLAQAGCAAEARVVVEKPFGRDPASARELDSILHRSFSEAAIFRIDHFLGKEPIQNILYTRFVNLFLEPIWNTLLARQCREKQHFAPYFVKPYSLLYDQLGPHVRVKRADVVESSCLPGDQLPRRSRGDNA